MISSLVSFGLALATFGPALAHPNCMADVIVGKQLSRRLYARSQDGTTWGYEGDKGDAFWAALDPKYLQCATGKYQSPINFEDINMRNAPSHRVKWLDTATGLSFINNGRTVQVNVPASSGFSIRSGPGNKKYNLAQFHFHAPSEHHFFKHSFEFEAHFVHLSSEKNIAVLGVWFQLSKVGSPFIDQLLSYGIPKNEQEVVSVKSLDFTPLKKALTKPNATFWSYRGSLTTPPCTEGVRWSVLEKPLPISIEQLEKFHAAMPFNSRSTAPVGVANSPRR